MSAPFLTLKKVIETQLAISETGTAAYHGDNIVEFALGKFSPYDQEQQNYSGWVRATLAGGTAWKVIFEVAPTLTNRHDSTITRKVMYKWIYSEDFTSSEIANIFTELLDSMTY